MAVDSRGNVIIATSRMGLAGSRGGGVIPQPAQAGVWRFAVDPSCAIGLCGYVVPTSPLIMFAAASQSVEEVTITPEDHLYVAVVDDRLVNQPARLGGLWAGRTDGSPLVSVGFMGADQLRNVVSVDLVTGSSAVDTVITGASLPKAAATDVERTDFEVTRTRVRWDQGPFPTPELLEPLAQTTAVNLDLYGHDGLHWFVDGTSVLGDEQYVVSSVEVLRDGRYLVAGKAGLWVYDPVGAGGPPWRPAVYGIGSTFLGDVALKGGTVFATDADRFLFRADLTVPQPDVRQELDQARTVAADITKGLSVAVLGDDTAIVGEATSTFGGVLLAVPPGAAPSWQLPLPVNRQPMALATVGDTVIVGIANSGLWAARWDTTTLPPALVEWRRLTAPGFPPPAAAAVTPAVGLVDPTTSVETTAVDTQHVSGDHDIGRDDDHLGKTTSR